ncbi:MAG: hypothetical protein O2781_02250 [Bacteroidetes bacterium]|nr:hypothetical protein [Bacteroidota bacterium]
MKYTIYINQKELSKTDFDLVDGAILDYLYFICNSTNEKIEEQRINGYTWVDYSKIIDDNPLLRIKSKGALSKRVKQMEELGFIKLNEIRKNGHKLKYFALTKKSDSLFTQTLDPIHQNENPIHQSEPISTIKDYTIKNNTIKNNTIKDKRALTFFKPYIEDIKYYFEERNNNLDAETFFDYYESKGWVVGNSPMIDWKASARNWEKRQYEKSKSQTMTKLDYQIDSWKKAKKLL